MTTVLVERGSVLECVSPLALSTRALRAGPSVASFRIPFPERAAEDCRTPGPADDSVCCLNAVTEVSSETVASGVISSIQFTFDKLALLPNRSRVAIHFSVGVVSLRNVFAGFSFAPSPFQDEAKSTSVQPRACVALPSRRHR